jgi:predicted metalloprotease with PDZ domain
MNRNLLFALIGSVLIHALILTSCGNSGQKENKRQEKAEGDEIRAKVISASMVEEQMKKKNNGKGLEALTNECKSNTFYTGIGITTNVLNIITVIAPGGPADKAGLKVGDTIINRGEFKANMFKVGDKLEIKVERYDKQFTTTTVIEKICYEAIP